MSSRRTGKSNPQLLRMRSGLTLIEVIAGLTLTMVLVTSGALAASRQSWQLQQSQSRIDACRALDQLLANWTHGPVGWPEQTSGQIEGHPDWTWSITRGTGVAPAELRVEVFRVTIWSQGVSRSSRALAFVEVWRANRQ